MRVLYGRCFGLGNAICAVPTIKALQLAGHTVDVLVGSTPDDGGAYDVMKHVVMNVFSNIVPAWAEHDMAIMAMPFDGRWKNGVHFKARQVIDGGPRPDPTTMGFSSWTRHEVEYQMDYARQLGYDGTVPSCSFIEREGDTIQNSVYLGMGYKKDAAGFWAGKHWGNENYARLIDLMVSNDRRLTVITTGDQLDLRMTIWPVQKMLPERDRLRVCHGGSSLQATFGYVGACETFLGNDTGMAHVAASFGLGVVPFYRMENAWTKSRPWCDRYELVKGHDREVSVEEFYEAFRRVHYGTR